MNDTETMYWIQEQATAGNFVGHTGHKNRATAERSYLRLQESRNKATAEGNKEPALRLVAVITIPL